jgi:uncharacterized protein YecE (DUF72 family)
MTRPPVHLYVGLSTIKGKIERYAQRFNLAEVRPGRDTLPKTSRLTQWRDAVAEDFAFSVLLPNEVAALTGSPDADRRLADALQVADALDARWLVLQTPPSVMPGARSMARLGDFFGKLRDRRAALAWEPRGVWQEDDAERLADDLGVHLVRDAARDPLPDTESVYCRVRGLGEASRLRMAAIEHAADELAERKEAFVLFDAAENAVSAADLLRRQIAGAAADLHEDDEESDDADDEE